ncbi:ribosylnicotinamide kinase [Yamadazyma tenuis]|uniref:p-loop containing nucleoside triphosphate hydrolase protein n=1 Tax=Candida tenuis (strain ATCC 10573 / BCRC 21748 / CBS 615 / JCM 9827 / NBRC 10315 / NRRL Y-1498 / VKM Y-70) TaxID=590646 RepID=G3BF80_CANTC|nr:P-loop containing nucleoside triphosphate hydrolase protein [Yamadazyma tenuis ATCC 10573]EGV60663.1 P-loop containing nucleoside triphosphate hydrolase protein [Yamadazyma tenuis ATCC 10573]WEJ94085.1 ribosylnicotinamide kinase [Yamadazyma tenuis]
MENKNNEVSDLKIIIVGISGPSSSGKTTVTKNLLNLLDCQILHQDDFYFPDDQIPVDHKTGEQNWDHPDSIDFDKFITYIQKVKAGEEFPEKIDTLEPDINLKLSAQEITELKAKLQNQLKGVKIVLVDGFMLFHDKTLVDLFDLKLFYYSTYDCLKSRRANRKGYSTIAGFWVDPPNYFDDYVWPAYASFHKHLFTHADVNNTLNEHALVDLKIRAYKNDDNSNITEMVSWSIEQILDYTRAL